MHPVSITFVQRVHGELQPEDWLTGSVPWIPSSQGEDRADCSMSHPMTLTRLLRDTFSALGRAWSQLWFQDSPTTPLEITRIGVGAAVLLHYTLAIPHLFEMWGNDGWAPREVALSIREPWMQSIFFYSRRPLAVGRLPRSLSTVLRRPDGRLADVVGEMDPAGRPHLLCLPQSDAGLRGRLDRLQPALHHVSGAGGARDEPGPGARGAQGKTPAILKPCLPPYHSPWAGACIRLMQIQMAVIFFYSAISKLNADSLAERRRRVDHVHVSDDYYHGIMVGLLASHYWMANLATYGTILVEIAFPFLIWQRSTRPYLLAAAIIPPSAVRVPDGSVLLLLRDDHGPF